MFPCGGRTRWLFEFCCLQQTMWWLQVSVVVLLVLAWWLHQKDRRFQKVGWLLELGCLLCLLRLIVSLILRGAPLLIVEEVFIVIVKIILCSSELNNPYSNRWCIQFFDSKSLFCMIFENLLNIRCPLYNFILLIIIW